MRYYWIEKGYEKLVELEFLKKNSKKIIWFFGKLSCFLL